MRQTSERKPSGKVYKKVTRSEPLPKEEWVAVPVPDAEHLLQAYEQRCVESLADLSPEEGPEVYKLLDLTVAAHNC